MNIITDTSKLQCTGMKFPHDPTVWIKDGLYKIEEKTNRLIFDKYAKKEFTDGSQICMYSVTFDENGMTKDPEICISCNDLASVRVNDKAGKIVTDVDTGKKHLKFD